MFCQQTIYKICNEELKADTSRKIEYLFENPYEKIDTTIYILSKSMTVETMLPVKDIKTDIASYRVNMTYNEAEHKLIIISHLVLEQNKVQPGSFNKLVEFFNAVNRSQDQKIVFRKE